LSLTYNPYLAPFLFIVASSSFARLAHFVPSLFKARPPLIYLITAECYSFPMIIDSAISIHNPLFQHEICWLQFTAGGTVEIQQIRLAL